MEDLSIFQVYSSLGLGHLRVPKSSAAY